MSDLKRVVKMANVLVKATDKVNDLEAQLKEAKKLKLKLEIEDIPALMEEVGLKELTLESGQKILIESDFKASITKKNKAAAINWLNKNNFGGLVKTFVSVPFGRGEHDVALATVEELSSQFTDVTLEENVHPQTLKSFVKEQLTAGKSVPMDLFGVFTYSKAKIK